MVVVYYLIFCLAVAFLGRARKIGALGFFIVSILVTPILGLLILVLTADRRVKFQNS